MKDVNGTRYHLLLGYADWQRSQIDPEKTPLGNRQWEYDDTHQVLHLQSEVFAFRQQGAAGSSLSANNRRDSDRDSYGHWYWLDETGTQVRVLWAHATKAEILFPQPPAPCPPTTGNFRPAVPTPPSTLEPLSGLAVMQEGYLVVGSPTTNSLLVFDLYAFDNGFLRVPLPLPPASPDDPRLLSRFDLAALADGGLLVLDRMNRQVWRLNPSLRLLPMPAEVPGTLTLFQPRQGQPRYEQAVPTAEAIALDTTDPMAIAPLPDGSFWILVQQAPDTASVLCHYSKDGAVSQSVVLTTINLIEAGTDDLTLGRIEGYDIAYLPNRDAQGGFLPTGILFVTDFSGNQAYALRVDSLTPLTLKLERQYFPLRSYKKQYPVSPPSYGSVALVAVWDLGDVYYHQAGDRWLPIKALPQRRYEKTATLLLPVMDGRDPNCLWHRLCVDACIPPETQLEVETRAADAQGDLVWDAWQTQPRLYQRHAAEVPYSSLWSEEDQVKPHTGTWELLFQQVQGRYLQIRLTLSGNGRNTPMVRAIRVHYPRFSYLREYLPDVYQQDPTSMSFLDRFLANPEGSLTTLEGLIAQAQTLLDLRTVPSEAVEWLASWIGLALEPGWSDYQRRLLIAQAPYFFQRRGTQLGLLQAMLLTLYPQLGPRIFQDDVAQLCSTVRIVERFLTRTQPGVAAGDPTETTLISTNDVKQDAKARAHRFTVMLPTTIDASTQRLVERIIALEKPAHTAFDLKQYWALFRVGEVRLGFDTVLGRGGQFDTFRLGQSALAEAALGETFPYTLTNRTVIHR
ncbi:hypothetical protein JOY44_02005 [Phormidium sp. CLA17]|uniref:phage tail protein n=1 Tax=Leptolyngbya sp. Cla-17 TaxID=2803751 RepID=UPI001492C6D2|nr:phage tail protein [Leptolyngbya sp. Cla-17]MBM0740401.1 hypothetical protein [Leptolyngbya sp. Cla-17]